MTLLLLQAWLKLIKQAVAETDVSQIMSNREAQHRYLTWRAEKVINFFPSSSFMHMPSWHLLGYNIGVNREIGKEYYIGVNREIS